MKKKKTVKIKILNLKFKKKLKNRSIWYYLTRYFISVFGVLLIVSIIFPFLNKSTQTFCANSISCVKNLSVDVENNKIGIFDGEKVMPPKIILPFNTPLVLGISTPSASQKHIYVDLSTQTLTAYDGNELFMKTLISSGRWHPTPTGTFRIWIKLPATTMTGGSGEDYYNLPNVPYVMYFANDEVPESSGFSLHGAYWHNDFGITMSHGCVNMRIVDAKKLYDWATPVGNDATSIYATSYNPGTLITITGSPPIY